ncbi:GIY-YIG nuclease family protein [Brevundimonas lenta]|uniref:Putative endonuclease n=1 Tax=Brevundimonas lenta TaxID=424796 RepID=A0A7W6NPW8_9CAUL|nr:putative endonuclease [Brevundimonas lenta]
MVTRDGVIGCYMMANRRHGTLYIGVSSDLVGRVHQHRQGLIEGFTKRHGLKRLVWYECHQSITAAIQREKSLKRYLRDWKTTLIERMNPDWIDLYDSLATGGAAWKGEPEAWLDWKPKAPEPSRPHPLPKGWNSRQA